MRLLILAILVVAGVAIGYPLLHENTNDLCGAMERRLVSVAAADEPDPATAILLGMFQKSFSNGALMRTLIKQYEPDLPPDVACDAAYWRIVIDPAGARALLEKLFRTHHASGQQAAPRLAVDAAMAPP